MNNLYIAIIIVCIVFSAFFSGTEIAFAKVNKVRLAREAESNKKSAKRAAFFVDNYNDSITTILIGNNLVNIAASSIATILFVNLFDKNGELIATIVITLLVLIFGEILPKTIFASYPNRLAKICSYPMTFFYYLFYPFTFIIQLSLRRFNKKLEEHEDEDVTDDELIEMVDDMEAKGIIDEDIQELVTNAIDFMDVDAVEVMIHRTDVFAYDISDDINNLLSNPDLLNYSRIPVYRDSFDNIIGILNTKQLIKKHLNGDVIDIEEMLTDPLYVFQTQAISDVLRKFRKEHIHMAIVKDEFGGNLGILTLEDVIEELVGEIYDEKDKDETEEYHKVSKYRFTVDGDMNIYDFFDLIHYNSDNYDGLYTTVSGWLTGELDKFPKVKDTITFNGYKITVIKADKFTVNRISVLKLDEDDENDDN